MKKILFINRYNLNHTGGIEEHLRNLTGFFVEKYYIVLLYYDRDNYGKNLMNFDVIGKSLFGFLFYNYSQYDVIFIENFNIFPHFFVVLRMVINKINRQDSYKVIFVPHGGFTPYWSMFSTTNKQIKKIYNEIIGLKFINNIVDDVIAVSNWEKNELSKMGIKQDIKIIGNGILCINSKDKDVTKENFFVFVGRIDPIKDILLMVKIFHTICQHKLFSNFKFFIIGPYKVNDLYYKSICSYINSNNLENKVIFLGPKYGDEKYDYIKKARCLFCLSKFETDPIVVKEALSVRTRVCISANYGLTDYINNKNTIVVSAKINHQVLYDFMMTPFYDDEKNNFLTWKQMSFEYEKFII